MLFDIVFALEDKAKFYSFNTLKEPDCPVISQYHDRLVTIYYLFLKPLDYDRGHCISSWVVSSFERLPSITFLIAPDHYM